MSVGDNPPMPPPHPSRRQALATLAATALLPAAARAADAPKPTNVVLFFCDDMGWGDLGCYGSKTNPTPNIDALASRGVRFTDFYATQAVCTASRAGLLTGCYSNRVGLLGALGPQARIGLNPDEFTLPRAAKQAGLATAIFGKWHLGHHPRFLPTSQGFDHWLGVPYSHDMWPRHPENPKAYPDLPLMQGPKTLRLNPEPGELVKLLTERAVAFVNQSAAKPFFLYMPLPLPHVPLGVSKDFAGKTGKGMYADVIAEIDWSVGQVLSALQRAGVADNTLVIFSSDNGPWTTYGDHSGSSGGLREAKGTSFEGGVRIPFIAAGPGLPRGHVCREPAMTIDLLPTLAKLWNVNLPADRIIDGKDITPLLRADPAARSPHEALYFYWNNHLQAVRMGKWKLHFPHDYRMEPAQRATGGTPTKARAGKIPLSLFDLEADPGEATDVSAQHPQVVDKIKQLADAMRQQLGDSATRQKGAQVREPGRL
jgi:arylsulfatase A-like enzyme